MPALELIVLATALFELASRIIELVVVIKEVLLTRKGKERQP